MTWLLKRHGHGSSTKKEDNTADGVTSFAQICQESNVTHVAEEVTTAQIVRIYQSRRKIRFAERATVMMREV